MRFTDLADFVGPTVNETPGAEQEVYGLVLHIQDGSQAGSLAWCTNPQSQVSAHFFAPKVGRLVQLVDTADMAWAEAAGNPHWISIENEGWTGQDLTPDQLASCSALLARLYSVYQVPLVPSDDPTARGLGWHGMGGDAWGGHPDCPGKPVLLQRPHIIAGALQLLGEKVPTPPVPPRSAPAWPGRFFRYPPADGVDIIGADVSEWQARMAWRGWTIAIDGVFGPQSETVTKEFQQDSINHGWVLVVDGIVGPLTWSAAWERPVS